MLPAGMRRLGRLHEQLRQAEQKRAEDGAFHLKDGDGNVIPHKTELDS